MSKRLASRTLRRKPVTRACATALGSTFRAISFTSSLVGLRAAGPFSFGLLDRADGGGRSSPPSVPASARALRATGDRRPLGLCLGDRPSFPLPSFDDDPRPILSLTRSAFFRYPDGMADWTTIRCRRPVRSRGGKEALAHCLEPFTVCLGALYNPVLWQQALCWTRTPTTTVSLRIWAVL